VALIDDPGLSIDDLIGIVPGRISRPAALSWAGQGIPRFIISAAARSSCASSLDETLRGDREAIIITEIRYQVNKPRWSSASANCGREENRRDRRAARDPTADGFRVVDRTPARGDCPRWC